jgi:hypothetical protein
LNDDHHHHRDAQHRQQLQRVAPDPGDRAPERLGHRPLEHHVVEDELEGPGLDQLDEHAADERRVGDRERARVGPQEGPEASVHAGRASRRRRCG